MESPGKGGPLFPVGSDAIQLTLKDGYYVTINLQQPFYYGGNTYSQLNLSMDGYVAFFVPYIDRNAIKNIRKNIIAPLWTDLDANDGGKWTYQQATNGSLIARANNEINKMFPNDYFSAVWVFVSTWTNVPVESSSNKAGYGFENSDIVSIPLKDSSTLSSTSNIKITGRWAFHFNACQSLNCTKDEVYPIETCSGSAGSLSLSRCQLFEAGYSIDILYLNDPTCKGTLQNGRLVFDYGSASKTCGTTLQNNGTHIIFKNSVGTMDGIGVISRANGLNLTFSCTYPVIHFISMPMPIQANRSVITKDLSNEGSYQISMTPFTDATFLKPFSGNVTLEVNHQMYIAVEVTPFDSNQVALVLDNCWATPFNQSDSSNHWDLIINECPSPYDGTVKVFQNGNSTVSQFSFRMFSFTGFSNKIYLHCKVHLCLKKSGNCALTARAPASNAVTFDVTIRTLEWATTISRAQNACCSSYTIQLPSPYEFISQSPITDEAFTQAQRHCFTSIFFEDAALPQHLSKNVSCPLCSTKKSFHSFA
ncbi:hypothetical protein C0J50_8971 [Silurus asotus]|uniref:ZP domain-containing protein n=1 Tax=Silurus asotus TaxID=30991 RepID=A0AAD5FG45_SILAS|nr:hypothetical protein C0J50_8971 [Silurus asotus]